MKRFTALLVCLLLIVSVLSPIASHAAAVARPAITIDDLLQNIYPNAIYTTADGYRVTAFTITNPDTIQALVNSGDVAKDHRGNLPESVTIYRYTLTVPVQTKTLQLAAKGDTTSSVIQPIAAPYITVLQREQIHRTSDNYISYDIVSGPSTMSTTYTATGTAEWTTTMSGSVEIGGEVFTVASLKAAVSAELGTTIGTSLSVSKEFTVTIPENKITHIKTYIIYTGFEYSATGYYKDFMATLGIGEAWTPCGLQVVTATYDYDQTDYFPEEP